MRKIFGTAFMVLVSLQTLLAQTDSTKSLTFSGSVDGYYRYNFNDAGGVSNNKTSFTNSQNSFALGMATIRADATALSGKVTATADLGFGPRAEEFSYYETASNSSLKLVKQLYLTYNLSKNVKITAGKFCHPRWIRSNGRSIKQELQHVVYVYQRPFLSHRGKI